MKKVIVNILIVASVFLNISCFKKIGGNDIFKKYDKKHINFFTGVGFDENGYINKWEENIKYDYVGQPHIGDIEILDTIFYEVMQIIKPIKIEKIKPGEKANLHIYFGDKMGDITPHSQGLSQPRWNNRIWRLSSTSLWADPESKGRKRQSIFRHELLHVLGLNHPPKGKFLDVVISPFFLMDERGWDDPNFILIYKYTDLDIAALSILYDKDIPNGLSLKAFKKAYEQYCDGKK